MVRGWAISVTAVPATCQWAEITSTAVGRGNSRPNSAQASAYLFGSMAYMGFPWPMNTTGIRPDGAADDAVWSVGSALLTPGKRPRLRSRWSLSSLPPDRQPPSRHRTTHRSLHG